MNVAFSLWMVYGIVCVSLYVRISREAKQAIRQENPVYPVLDECGGGANQSEFFTDTAKRTCRENCTGKVKKHNKAVVRSFRIADFANTQGNNAQNSGLYGNLANMAGSRVTLAAAAQEAAQNPAFRAWNASMGLNGATTNALAGIAGKGASTQTSTQMQSGGGGFLGGLLGGALGGAGQALGMGIFR